MRSKKLSIAALPQTLQPAFWRPNICEVRNPFVVGSRRLEGAIEHVHSDGGRRRFASSIDTLRNDDTHGAAASLNRFESRSEYFPIL